MEMWSDALARQIQVVESAARRAFTLQWQRLDLQLAAQRGLYVESAAVDALTNSWGAISELGIRILTTGTSRPIRAAFTRGQQQAAASLRISLDVGNQAAEDYARRDLPNRMRDIDDTTFQEIREIVANGIRDGESYTTVRNRIQERFVGFTRSRARLIALSEIGEAHEFAQRYRAELAVASGLTVEKIWILSSGACRICIQNQGAQVKINDSFPSGHSRPLAHPGCRCASQYVPV